MTDTSSVMTFVMAAQLPWPDDAAPADALGALDPVALIVGGGLLAMAITYGVGALTRRSGGWRRSSPAIPEFRVARRNISCATADGISACSP